MARQGIVVSEKDGILAATKNDNLYDTFIIIIIIIIIVPAVFFFLLESPFMFVYNILRKGLNHTINATNSCMGSSFDNGLDVGWSIRAATSVVISGDSTIAAPPAKGSNVGIVVIPRSYGRCLGLQSIFRRVDNGLLIGIHYFSAV